MQHNTISRILFSFFLLLAIGLLARPVQAEQTSPSEYDQQRPNQQRFERIDRNNDGQINNREQHYAKKMKKKHSDRKGYGRGESNQHQQGNRQLTQGSRSRYPSMGQSRGNMGGDMRSRSGSGGGPRGGSKGGGKSGGRR